MQDFSELFVQAQLASNKSFCQHSGFAVGSALLIRDQGQEYIVQGINYETNNYQSICAERHALQNATLLYSKNLEFVKIAIFSPNSQDYLVPCGMCRQALFERNPGLEVICFNSIGQWQAYSISELLPNGFKF